MIKPLYDLAAYSNEIDEFLLADIALKIQLTPTEFSDVVAHYQVCLTSTPTEQISLIA